jgi:V-type H+-transporting ATPase subunit E
VAELIPDCKKAFQEIVRKENMDDSIAEVDLRLDERYSLTLKNVDETTERTKKSDESSICFGGVIMTNEDGLIVCKNTLDTRLELAYQHLLPDIRTTLYS